MCAYAISWRSLSDGSAPRCIRSLLPCTVVSRTTLGENWRSGRCPNQSLCFVSVILASCEFPPAVAKSAETQSTPFALDFGRTLEIQPIAKPSVSPCRFQSSDITWASHTDTHINGIGGRSTEDASAICSKGLLTADLKPAISLA